VARGSKRLLVLKPKNLGGTVKVLLGQSDMWRSNGITGLGCERAEK